MEREEARHTRRNVDEREQGNALRVAQMQPNKHLEVRLEAEADGDGDDDGGRLLVLLLMVAASQAGQKDWGQERGCEQSGALSTVAAADADVVLELLLLPGLLLRCCYSCWC